MGSSSRYLAAIAAASQRGAPEARNIPYQDKAVKYLLQEFYIKKNRTPRASHPRDLLDQLEDIAAYLNTEPRLSKTLLDRAVSSYFVDM